MDKNAGAWGTSYETCPCYTERNVSNGTFCSAFVQVAADTQTCNNEGTLCCACQGYSNPSCRIPLHILHTTQLHFRCCPSPGGVSHSISPRTADIPSSLLHMDRSGIYHSLLRNHSRSQEGPYTAPRHRACKIRIEPLSYLHLHGQRVIHTARTQACLPPFGSAGNYTTYWELVIITKVQICAFRMFYKFPS